MSRTGKTSQDPANNPRGGHKDILNTRRLFTAA
jgi:hypothetical protein